MWDAQEVVSKVSVPEKTLEHWMSTYLHNRFPKSALWWPTHGEDIAVDLRRALGARGRSAWALALEVKTARPDTNGVHEVRIRLDQLDRYLAGRGQSHRAGAPLPVFYALPMPHWSGILTPSTPARTCCPSCCLSSPEEWWRQKACCNWFGQWTVVLSAQAVGRALDARLAISNTTWQDELKSGRKEAVLYSSAPLPPFPTHKRHSAGHPLPTGCYNPALPLITDPIYLWPDFWYALMKGAILSFAPVWRTRMPVSGDGLSLEVFVDGEAVFEEDLVVDQSNDDRVVDDDRPSDDDVDQHCSIVILDVGEVDDDPTL